MSEEFHIAIGGPFQRAERAAHVEPLRRLLPLLIGITWAPILLLASAQRLITGHADPLARDLSVHARLLVALPLLLVGERLLDRLVAVTVDRLFDENFIPPAAAPRIRALLARVAHWRDAALPEALLLAAAVLSGVASLVGLLPPAGALHGTVESHYTATRIWYGLVSLPLFQFLLWHSLFRWALWIRVLIGLSRVRLQLVPAHADRHAGIGFLKFPTLVYCALMLLVVSSVLCAGWATQMELYGARLQSFKPLFAAYMLIALVIAVGPLMLFVPQLLAARIDGRSQYGNLVTDYTRRFHERWIFGDDRFGLLGTPHIQSLADLGTSYRENIEEMHTLLFTSKDALLLLVAAFVPAIPLLFLEGPAHEVIKRVLRLLLGGMPL
jgi:hypothetical protein